jgi:hypothetical protein
MLAIRDCAMMIRLMDEKGEPQVACGSLMMISFLLSKL